MGADERRDDLIAGLVIRGAADDFEDPAVRRADVDFTEGEAIRIRMLPFFDDKGGDDVIESLPLRLELFDFKPARGQEVR